MKPNPVLGRKCASRAVVALLMPLSVLASACESDSVFEGAPTVAPPVAAFDREATAQTAVHGGVLAVAVTAEDPYVGVDSLIVRYSGKLQGSFTRRFTGAPRQVRVDTALPVPFGTEGAVLLETYALNRYGSTARIDSLTATIVRQDTIRPTVTMQSAVLPQRAELSGTMSFTVAGRDDAFGGGLERVGVAVRVDGSLVVESTPVAGSGMITRDIVLQVSRLTASAPAALSVEYYAWAVDRAGNCTAAGAGGVSVACTFVGGALAIPSLSGLVAALQVTATNSLGALAPAAAVGDLVVDAVRRRIYISNQSNNSIEAISWSAAVLSRVPGAPALVGSRPLGMTLDRTGDTLIVANSGGTNLSYVALGTLQEQHRYETRNSTLYELSDNVLSHLDYSDRPQYLAQDAYGVVFYSTTPTSAAPQGTIQTVEWDAIWQQRENNLMLWSQIADKNGWGPGIPPLPCYDEFNPQVQPCIFAFADSIKLNYESPLLATQLEVYDHVPGYPDRKISIISADLRMITSYLADQGSDIFMFRGEWTQEDLDYWLSGDTTMVAASGDRSSVVFSEADVGSDGQVWAWNALEPHPRQYERLISDVVNIDDLVNNTASPMNSLSLNFTGTLIATRSADAAFFFTNPLRLRGTYSSADIAGGTGLALHPDARFEGGTPNGNWAAAGTADPEIALIDTRNFRRVGTIPLLEPVGGPIRVIPPVSGDPGNVVAHIFGVTNSGAVFHVAVRTSDILP